MKDLNYWIRQHELENISDDELQRIFMRSGESLFLKELHEKRKTDTPNSLYRFLGSFPQCITDLYERAILEEELDLVFPQKKYPDKDLVIYDPAAQFEITYTKSIRDFLREFGEDLAPEQKHRILISNLSIPNYLYNMAFESNIDYSCNTIIYVTAYFIIFQKSDILSRRRSKENLIPKNDDFIVVRNTHFYHTLGNLSSDIYRRLREEVIECSQCRSRFFMAYNREEGWLQSYPFSRSGDHLRRISLSPNPSSTSDVLCSECEKGNLEPSKVGAGF